MSFYPKCNNLETVMYNVSARKKELGAGAVVLCEDPHYGPCLAAVWDGWHNARHEHRFEINRAEWTLTKEEAAELFARGIADGILEYRGKQWKNTEN